MTAFTDLTVESITGDQVDFDRFQDTVCLVVNVASQ
jgi:glutathione peroxidase-family protein